MLRLRCAQQPAERARWPPHAADSVTRAFITPHVARLRVQAEPTCYALRLTTQRTGPWELREGALLNFENKVFARLTSPDRSYWRNLTAPRISDAPSPDAGNYLLSYLGLEFPDPAEPDERERAHLLTPADHLFDYVFPLFFPFLTQTDEN